MKDTLKNDEVLPFDPLLTNKIPKPYIIEDCLNDNASDNVGKGQKGAEPPHKNNLFPTLPLEAIDVKILGDKKKTQQTEISSDHLQSKDRKTNSDIFKAAKQECEKTQTKIKQFIEFSSKKVHLPVRDRRESDQKSSIINKNVDEKQIYFRSNNTENTEMNKVPCDHVIMRYSNEVHSANGNTPTHNEREAKEPLAKLQDTKGDQFFMMSRKISHQSEKETKTRLEFATQTCNVLETTHVNDKKKQSIIKVRENPCCKEKVRYMSPRIEASETICGMEPNITELNENVACLAPLHQINKNEGVLSKEEIFQAKCSDLIKTPGFSNAHSNSIVNNPILSSSCIAKNEFFNYLPFLYRQVPSNLDHNFPSKAEQQLRQKQGKEINEFMTLCGDSKYTTSLLEKPTSFTFETVNKIQVNLLKRIEGDVAKNEAIKSCENILQMSLCQLENEVLESAKKVNDNTLSIIASVETIHDKCNDPMQKNAYKLNRVQAISMEGTCNSLINNGSLQKSKSDTMIGINEFGKKVFSNLKSEPNISKFVGENVVYKELDKGRAKGKETSDTEYSSSNIVNIHEIILKKFEQLRNHQREVEEVKHNNAIRLWKEFMDNASRVAEDCQIANEAKAVARETANNKHETSLKKQIYTANENLFEDLSSVEEKGILRLFLPEGSHEIEEENEIISETTVEPKFFCLLPVLNAAETIDNETKSTSKEITNVKKSGEHKEAQDDQKIAENITKILEHNEKYIQNLRKEKESLKSFQKMFKKNSFRQPFFWPEQYQNQRDTQSNNVFREKHFHDFKTASLGNVTVSSCKYDKFKRNTTTPEETTTVSSLLLSSIKKAEQVTPGEKPLLLHEIDETHPRETIRPGNIHSTEDEKSENDKDDIIKNNSIKNDIIEDDIAKDTSIREHNCQNIVKFHNISDSLIVKNFSFKAEMKPNLLNQMIKEKNKNDVYHPNSTELDIEILKVADQVDNLKINDQEKETIQNNLGEKMEVNQKTNTRQRDIEMMEIPEKSKLRRNLNVLKKGCIAKTPNFDVIVEEEELAQTKNEDENKQETTNLSFIRDDRTLKTPHDGDIYSKNSNNSNKKLLLENNFPINMEEYEDTKTTNWQSGIYKESLENMKSFTRKRLMTMKKVQDETNLNKYNNRIRQEKVPKAPVNTSVGETRDVRKKRKRPNDDDLETNKMKYADAKNYDQGYGLKPVSDFQSSIMKDSESLIRKTKHGFTLLDCIKMAQSSKD